MLGKVRKQLNNERGAATIVEAAFIFPIMFIVLIFLIYMGNAFYIKTQIDGIVVDKAIKGASYCADPMLQTIEETGTVPALSDLDVQPYRYLFGGMNDIEDLIAREAENEIKGTYTSFFKNMKPVVNGCEAKFNNKIIYSSFSVDAKCTIGFPIRMLASDQIFSIDLNVRSEVAVNDTTEFIRNVDMAIDYFGDTPLANKISSVFEKIRDFMDNFAEK